MTRPSVAPVILRGHVVDLEPMTPEHADDLAAAAAEDRSTFSWTTVPDGPGSARAYIDRALAEHADGRALPFVVRRLASGRIVGSTRFVDLEWFDLPPGAPSASVPGHATPSVAEIGYTWYARCAQRTGVNTESKLLMLEHAFETWQVLRVTLKTDARNERSRQAILRLGAAFEGIRRRHRLGADGAVRDTAYYSIVAEEWPEVRERLAARLRL